MNEFGNHLYALRRGKGMTQQELADRLGVTNRTISKWETGETFPETAQLVPLADVFHITVDELLRGKTTASSHTDTPNFSQNIPENSAKSADSVSETADSVSENIASSERRSIPPKIAVVIASGIGIFLVGVIVLIILYTFWKSPYVSAVALGVLFACVLAGGSLCVFGGVTTEFVPRLKTDDDRRAFRAFRCFVLFGIGGFLFGAALFTEGWLVRAYADVLSIVLISVGGVVAAAGIVVLVYGGIGWERHLQLAPYLRSENEKATEQERRRNALSEKICAVIMILAIIAYLLMGFLGDLWHPGWIVFPVAALLCGIISVVLEKKK